MLPINSTNDVLPGGPVSNVAGRNEIFGGGKAASASIATSTRTRLTIVGARIFAGVGETARRILQHSIPAGCGCGFAGLEWNGQPLWVVSVFAVTARSAQ